MILLAVQGVAGSIRMGFGETAVESCSGGLSRNSCALTVAEVYKLETVGEAYQQHTVMYNY